MFVRLGVRYGIESSKRLHLALSLYRYRLFVHVQHECEITSQQCKAVNQSNVSDHTKYEHSNK